MIYDLFCDLVILQHREGDVKMCAILCLPVAPFWRRNTTDLFVPRLQRCVTYLDITTKRRKKSGLHPQCLQFKHLAET